jgi:hypothetical protein
MTSGLNLNVARAALRETNTDGRHKRRADDACGDNG